MRVFLSAVALVCLAAPAVMRADVTIRYRSETSLPMSPAANRSTASAIYMKGNKGVTIEGSERTIVDLARQEVTVIDTARKKYATVTAAEYGSKMGESVTAMMPQAPGMAEMLKSMKSACETKQSDVMETIQGVQAMERDVTCTMTMSTPGMAAGPGSTSGSTPGISVKIVRRIWSAAPRERLRVPGLWQLAGFEAWQNTFMNSAGAFSKMMPDMQPMVEAMQKDQSATLRSSTETSSKMSMAGMPERELVSMKMTMEMVGVSTELLDDSLFSVPGDCIAEPFGDLMKGIFDAAKDSVNADIANARPAVTKAIIPENVKAYIPPFSMIALTDSEPAAPVDANGNKLHGMVDLLLTVGPKGNVEQTEVLYGPEELRKAASDAARQWTYRPVIRNGEPVAAYTEEMVNFFDDSKEPPAAEPFQVMPEMTAAGQRLQQFEEAFPRSPEQELADIEQDSGGGGKQRRYYRLGELAMKAVQIGADDKAKAYATELLEAAQDYKGDPNTSRAVHTGHSVLGIVALRGGDVETAREQLLEAGKTPASPVPTPYGPNMLLASELLKKGERDTVLEYIELCRNFWKEGGAQLDAMRDTVKAGGTPDFNLEMPQ